MPRKMRPLRTERRTDRDLAAASLGTDEEEIRDVRTRDQQHQTDGREQNPEYACYAADDGIAQRDYLWRESGPSEEVGRIGARELRGKSLDQALELDARIFRRNTGPKTSDCLEVVDVPRLRGGVQSAAHPDGDRQIGQLDS